MTGAPGDRRTRAWAIALTIALAATLVGTAGGPAAADGNEAPGAPLAARSITTGFAHSCALLDDGSVRCWGNNQAGQLGRGNTANRGDGPNEMGLPAVDLGTGRTATAISAGALHTCALLDDGTVKCWGWNDKGQLGLGNTEDQGDDPGEMGDALLPVELGTGRTATAISVAGKTSCARLDNGTVKCWGENHVGQLGLGDTDNRGDQQDEMGDELPAVELGTGRTAAAISAGDWHQCALLDNATVKCWGVNDVGQLGLGNTTPHGDVAGTMGDALPTVDLGTGRTATAISAGPYSHSCALLDNGTVKCWGRNDSGQLGLGAPGSRGNNPDEMGDDLPAVDLGTGRTATAISAGDANTCVLLDDATVKCWGWNNTGELGLGDTVARGGGAGEMGDALPAVDLGTGRTATAVTMGSIHTCAVLDNGTVKCWGQNYAGMLGVGDTATRGDGPNEMGDRLPVATILDADAVLRPDGRIRLAGAFAGNDLYNTTGEGQTRATTVGRFGTAVFTVRIQNDGDAWDNFTLRGQATTPRFTVIYRDGATVITNEVVAGTYTLANLAPGATRDITVRIKPRPGTTRGTVVRRTLTTRSTNSPGTRDTVRAQVTRG